MEFRLLLKSRTLDRGLRARKARPGAGRPRPLLEALESRELLAVKFTEFSIPTANSQPARITLGPDARLWFTESSFGASKVANITTSGVVTEIPPGSGATRDPAALPQVGSQPFGIATGPDGNLWFTEGSTLNPRIGRVTTSGTVTEFNVQVLPGGGTSVIPAGSNFGDITSNPNGNLYFTDTTNNRIGTIVAVSNGGLPVGAISFFPSLPTANSGPTGIVSSADGNVWFTQRDANSIGRLNPTTGVVTEFPLPTANSQPFEIVAIGNVLYFTEAGGNAIGRIDGTGAIAEFAIPTANSQPRDLTVAADGSIYFAQSNANQIGRFDPATGSFLEFALPNASGAPTGITTDQSGNIWFTEINSNRIGTLALPAPLQAQPVAISGVAGQALVNIPVATFSDPSGNDPLANYSATIDWGDGTATSAGTISLNGGSFLVRGSHTYANPGSFGATVTIRNTVDGRVVAVLSPATIQSGPIIPTPPPGTVNASAGTPVLDVNVGNFTGSDPASAYQVSIDWGDGSALGGGRVVGSAAAGFSVIASHTFAAPGTFNGTVTVRNGSGVATSFPVTSTVTSFTAASTGLIGTAGTPIASGSLALLTKNAASPDPVAQFYNATIDWGDGTPSTSATVSVVGGALLLTGGGHTYAAPGNYTITYTLGNAGAPGLVTGTSTATVTGLTGTGVPVSVIEGVALGNVVLANASASPGAPNPVAGFYSATIDWGDGSAASPGFISNTAAGDLAISGASHVYKTPGAYTVRILLGTTGFPNLAVITTIVNVTANPAFALSGQLNPASDSGVSNTDGITNVTTPNFFGKAAPGAIVRVFAQRADQVDPVLIAQTVADAGGAWSVTAPEIADGSYVVTADTVDAAGMVLDTATIKSAAAPLVIDTVGPVINGFSIVSARNGQFQVIYRDDRSGLDGQTLVDGANYGVARTFPKTNPHRYFLISNLLATGVAPGTNPATVTGQVFDGVGKFRLKNGLFVFTIKDIQDLAGNVLDGDFYGSFPTGNGTNGGAFVARVAVKGLKPGPILPVSSTANPNGQPIPVANLVPPQTARQLAAANKAAAKAARAGNKANRAQTQGQALAKPAGKATGSSLFKKLGSTSVAGLISRTFK